MTRKPVDRDPLADWFERLVAHKMTALAIPVSGMAVACTVLTLAEVLSPRMQSLVEDVGLALLAASTVTFTWSMVRLVARSLDEEPRVSSRRKTRLPEQRPPADRET